MCCFCCATASAAGRAAAKPSSAMVVSMSVRRRFMMCLVWLMTKVRAARERSRRTYQIPMDFPIPKKGSALRACQPMEYCCPCPASHGPLPQGQDVNHATPSGATVKRRLSKRPDIPPAPGEIARHGSWRDAANWNMTQSSFCTNSKPPAQGCSRRITIVSVRPTPAIAHCAPLRSLVGARRPRAINENWV